MKIVTVEQMRAVEAASVRYGVSLDQLQRNAAAAVAREMEQALPMRTRPALFVVGTGNNGRDALMAAQLLRQRGWNVQAFLAPGVASEDIRRLLTEGGVPLYGYSRVDDLEILRRWVHDAGLVVDGLLGIGIRGVVRDPLARIISVVNEESGAAAVPVVGVDLPSGIDADMGEVAGVAVRCDLTVSLGCVKAGLLRWPAAEYVGELVPVEIGLPEESTEAISSELLIEESVARMIPPRPLQGHKGTFGRVLVVAGSRDFAGAPFLVGAAAARAGCGLVTFAVPQWQRAILAPMLPEATYLLPDEAEEGLSTVMNRREVAEVLPRCQALVLGPGLGQSDASAALALGVLEAAAAEMGLGVVVDADGLNALAGQEGWWERIGTGRVLTPHPGEMARLTGLSIAEVNADRWSVAREAARRWQQTVVLKGAFTVVAGPDGVVTVSPFALPALATAGSGDVLAGLIAGLMAQGTAPDEAARAGVYLHALAAQRALEARGIDRLLAGDLLPEIPVAIAGLVREAGRERSAKARVVTHPLLERCSQIPRGDLS